METKKLLNKKITQWLLLVAMLVGCSASAWASNIYITAPGGTRINVYTFSGCNAGNWPGKNVTTNAIAYDQGGFYSFTSCSTTSSYSYIINNSSQQTGNLSLSEDTWGYYNNNTSFSVLMKNSTLSSVACKFASGSISGWGTQVSATWDSSKKKFKYTCSNWGGSSGIDVYLGGTKFLYKSCTQSAGNYIIYWDPYTGNFTFESPCTAPSFSSHPSTTDKTYCQNATATALSVTASGTATLSYQWKQCSTSGGTYTDISGATSSSYTPSTATAGKTYYKCYVSNSCGSATSDASGAITVKAKPTAYAVSGTASICTGNSTDVTLANSQTGYTYKLYKNSSATSTTKTGTGSALNFSVSEAGTYTVKGYVTGIETCSTDMTNSASVTSIGATITNVTPAEAHPYEIVTLTASKSATWSITGTPSEVANDEYYPVSGNTGKTFSFKGAKGTGGNYTVRASADDCNTETTIPIANDPNKCN